MNAVALQPAGAWNNWEPVYGWPDERATGLGCAFCGDGGALIVGRAGRAGKFDTCQTCFDALVRAPASGQGRPVWLRRPR